MGFYIAGNIGRIDPRIRRTLGYALRGVSGLALATVHPAVQLEWVERAELLQGLSNRILWTSVTLAGFSTLSPKRLANGTAILHLRNVGQSICIVLSFLVIVLGGPTSIHSGERARETRVSFTIRPNAPLPSRELACTFDSNRLFLAVFIGSLIPMRIPFFADSSSPEHCASAMGALEPASDVLDTIAGTAQAAQPNDIRPRKRRS